MNHFALAGVNAASIAGLALVFRDQRTKDEFGSIRVTVALVLLNIASLAVNLTIGLTS